MLYPSLDIHLLLKLTRKECKQRDQRTRKLMTMHDALHPRDDVDRLYVSTKEGGRRLANTEYNIDAFIQWLEAYIEKPEERLFTATKNDNKNTKTNRLTIARNQKWKKNNSMVVLND